MAVLPGRRFDWSAFFLFTIPIGAVVTLMFVGAATAPAATSTNEVRCFDMPDGTTYIVNNADHYEPDVTYGPVGPGYSLVIPTADMPFYPERCAVRYTVSKNASHR